MKQPANIDTSHSNAAGGERPRAGGIPRLRGGAIPLLSYGFRPFFLGAALWACLAMVLWIGLLWGQWSFAQNYGAVSWHAHELLFGYLSAVLTGFLLTAIPNWTGRLPLQGTPLLLLALLWLVGRLAMLCTDRLGVPAAAVIDALYLFVVSAVIAREVVAGANWRNLKVVLLTTLLAIANVIYHAEIVTAGASNYGMRVGVAAVIGLIMLVGGRITPSFTHNWLARQGSKKLPVPLNRFDFAAIGVMALALAAWIGAPEWKETAFALFAASLLQALRVARWAGERTWREPIVFILHVGYAFVPLGALTLGISILWPDLLAATSALHAWTAGAVGVMTLAVMTRATRGHTGHAIETTPMTLVIYIAIVVAALTRVAAPMIPDHYMAMLGVSAACWFAAYAVFVLAYGPLLIRARRNR